MEGAAKRLDLIYLPVPQYSTANRSFTFKKIHLFVLTFEVFLKFKIFFKEDKTAFFFFETKFTLNF
jgi:hypothetical protein